MIIKPSPLKLVQFFITQIEVDFSDPKKYENFDIAKEAESYEVDVDFSIKQHAKQVFHVFVKIEVNKAQSLSGYAISSECLGIFHLIESDMSSDDMIKRLINTSALVMTLNYLRAYIANATSSMPWGQYFLPSIDMQDLHAKKMQLIKELKKKKKNPSKNEISKQ